MYGVTGSKARVDGDTGKGERAGAHWVGVIG